MLLAKKPFKFIPETSYRRVNFGTITILDNKYRTGPVYKREWLGTIEINGVKEVVVINVLRGYVHAVENVYGVIGTLVNVSNDAKDVTVLANQSTVC